MGLVASENSVAKRMPHAAVPARFLSGLAEIAPRYDVILCDVWGVIHNGRESFPLAVAALEAFGQRIGKPVVLISNAPRPSFDVRPQLRALKVPDTAFSGFVTSGDATRAELARRAPGPAWAIGPERDGPLYEGLDLTFAGPDRAAFISATGLIDDETETPETYRADLQIAAARGLTLVCANPDRVVHRGEKLIYCAGALADLYEGLGGQVVMAGKPYAPIYDLALIEAERLLGAPVRPERVLAIGDGGPTDVAGANLQGLDCLFIAGGIHQQAVSAPDGGIDEALTRQFLSQAGLTSTYVLPHLRW